MIKKQQISCFHINYTILVLRIESILFATSLNSVSKKWLYVLWVTVTLECPALLLIICACIPLDICSEIDVCLNPWKVILFKLYFYIILSNICEGVSGCIFPPYILVKTLLLFSHLSPNLILLCNCSFLYLRNKSRVVLEI